MWTPCTRRGLGLLRFPLVHPLYRNELRSRAFLHRARSLVFACIPVVIAKGFYYIGGFLCTCPPSPARCNIMTFVDVVNIVHVADFVYQAGAGTWGVPAASPQQRGGWPPRFGNSVEPKVGRAAAQGQWLCNVVASWPEAFGRQTFGQ